MSLINSVLWLDVKYTNLVSYRLDHFKRVSTNNTYKFRCPLCGDSDKNKLKTRGYIYEKEGRLRFQCHNCGRNMGFSFFLKEIDPGLFREYSLEVIRETGAKTEYKPDIGKFSKPRFTNFKHLSSLKKISQLRHDHPALVYVRDHRRIPSKYHYKLFYCPKFMNWVNTIIPGKFEAKLLANDEPRLIIPFIDENGYVFGFQGRSFKKKTDLRYITIMLDEDKTKVFGLDTLDKTKKTFILEGPIDSMFVPNSIAFAGSDGNISAHVNIDRSVFVFDNEPRNQAICKKIFNNIMAGNKVVIWPDTVKDKDINDLVMGGVEVSEIPELLDTNTFQGMSALIRFNTWKKCTI